MPPRKSRGQESIPASDGLPALEVSEHTREKEAVFENYAGIFTSGMRNLWPNLYYVDPFAGPGICRIKESGEDMDGSPLLAAKSKSGFRSYFLGDNNPEFIEALRQRFAQLDIPQKAKANFYTGDANVTVREMLKELPNPKQLGLAVIDPWGWDIAFETIASLSEKRRLDLVIYFPVYHAILNWNNDVSSLDRFMNGESYKENFRSAMRREGYHSEAIRVLLDAYNTELVNIGYKFVRDNYSVRLSPGRGRIQYCLLFASKHERGADFWDKITRQSGNSQMRMPI